ncbi:F-box protein, partial [Paraburkholderia sp. RL17-373-BIF-A]|uniref:hypothetical protein n=1 Tax=Paraburkholderia sp. RL17-373-BIF-A TaxID=3031629 RepID=UPI0038B9391D
MKVGNCLLLSIYHATLNESKTLLKSEMSDVEPKLGEVQGLDEMRDANDPDVSVSPGENPFEPLPPETLLNITRYLSGADKRAVRCVNREFAGHDAHLVRKVDDLKESASKG